jgi:hypothetical protein
VRVAGAQITYRLRVSAHDLAVALDIATDFVTPIARAAFESRRPLLERYLAERITVAAGDRSCRPAPAVLEGAPLTDDLVIVLRYDCPVPVRRLAIRYGLFFDLDPGHRSLGRVVFAGREAPVVFDRSLRHLDLEAGAPAGWPATFGRVLWLGVEHMLLGYDHLLFLLALLIGATRLGAVVRVVTAFTVAHSLTLALGWYRVLALPSRPVEVAIAASIAWVALENVAGRGAGRRWLVAGGFGLVHGLGFYGALRELGLEGADVVTTLVAFNLGVEVGQVALVALLWRPLRWWARQAWHRASARAGSVAILITAIWWVIQRAVAG